MIGTKAGTTAPPPLGGVRLFRALPGDYGAISIRTSHQRTDIGPCLLLYDASEWKPWDEPFWSRDAHGGGRRAAGEGGPCKLCGQDFACLSGGPGALALWQGPDAQCILDALHEADEEWLLAAAWEKFCRTAPLPELSDHEGLARHVLDDGFRGFRRLGNAFGRGLEWLDSCDADLDPRPDWAEFGTPLDRSRHLPALLSILASLGVAVPAQPGGLEVQVTAGEHARAGATAACRRIADDRRLLAAEIAASGLAARPRVTLFPALPPPTAAEELAEALMGYDHATGEKRPWGPFEVRHDMRGHNSGTACLDGFGTDGGAAS